jgi:2-methylisocitrate lyase-like PEP mutase family enzyme
VNVDFQAGYARDLDELAVNVQRCVDTGAAGLSIEDMSGDPAQPLFDRATALARLKAARRAIDESGTGVLLTARTECFLVGHPSPLPEAITRLESFAAAGADVLYAPGLTTAEEIQAIVKAVHPKPVNVIMNRNFGLRTADVAALGARRISVGSALARAAWGGFLRAARQIANEGSFAAFDENEPFAAIDRVFTRNQK